MGVTRLHGRAHSARRGGRFWACRVAAACDGGAGMDAGRPRSGGSASRVDDLDDPVGDALGQSAHNAGQACPGVPHDPGRAAGVNARPSCTAGAPSCRCGRSPQAGSEPDTEPAGRVGDPLPELPTSLRPSSRSLSAWIAVSLSRRTSTTSSSHSRRSSTSARRRLTSGAGPGMRASAPRVRAPCPAARPPASLPGGALTVRTLEATACVKSEVRSSGCLVLRPVGQAASTARKKP